MAVHSAGILAYRTTDSGLQVFLVHPGGPFWAGKDQQSWSIPKGEFSGEEALDAARREFEEETGQAIEGDFEALGPIRAGNKIIHAFAVRAQPDADDISSNTFEMEWPPGSGRRGSFPEVDRAAWFSLTEAATRLVKGQRPLIDALVESLGT